MRGGARGAVERDFCPPCFGQVFGSLASFCCILPGVLEENRGPLAPRPLPDTLLGPWLCWGTPPRPRAPGWCGHPSPPCCAESSPPRGCPGRGSAVGIYLQQAPRLYPLPHVLLHPSPSSGSRLLPTAEASGSWAPWAASIPLPFSPMCYPPPPAECTEAVLGAPATFLGRLGFLHWGEHHFQNIPFPPPPPLRHPMQSLVLSSALPPPPFRRQQHLGLLVSVGVQDCLPSSTGRTLPLYFSSGILGEGVAAKPLHFSWELSSIPSVTRNNHRWRLGSELSGR